MWGNFEGVVDTVGGRNEFLEDMVEDNLRFGYDDGI